MEYSSVSPYLVMEGAQQVVDFIQEVFDGRVLRRYDRPDGPVMHIELHVDDTIVMLGDATVQSTNTQLHVYVKLVKCTYDRAVVAGYASVSEPTRSNDGPDGRAGIKDPAGNIWWIATQEE
jgi:PhnB protein